MAPTALAALQKVGPGTNVTFRLVNYSGSGPSGTWYVADTAGSPALDLAVQDLVTQWPPTNNAMAAAPTGSSPMLRNHQFQFTLTGTAEAQYVIQAAANLTAPNWILLTPNTASFVFVQTNASQFSQRFYRGLVAP